MQNKKECFSNSDGKRIDIGTTADSSQPDFWEVPVLMKCFAAYI
jgi:hypothetical protein